MSNKEKQRQKQRQKRRHKKIQKKKKLAKTNKTTPHPLPNAQPTNSNNFAKDAMPDYGKHLINKGFNENTKVILTGVLPTTLALDPNGKQIVFKIYEEDRSFMGSLITQQNTEDLEKLIMNQCMVVGKLNPTDSWTTPEGTVVPIYGELTAAA